MSYNGSGTFTINTTGQPVVAGTVISSSAFNSLTNDLATGLTTAITKDGQTTTTARITFAQGITSSLVTDSSSTSTGSIITAGGVGIAKNLYVGGLLDVAGATSFTNPTINNIKMGYTTTATAAGTTTLTVASNYRQFFTGTSTQTIVLPVTSTLVTGIAYEIENNSTGTLTVNSSGGNLVGTIPAGVCAHAVCIGTTLTTAADWDWDYISTSTITGTGANVLGTSPTITSPTLVTPALGTPASGVMTNVTGINYDGYKNRIINGAMTIWQRATSQTFTNSLVYGSVDRWVFIQGGGSASIAQTQSTSVPTGFQYAIKQQRTAASTTTGTVYSVQEIETANCYDLAGQAVTLSFWAKCGANFSASGSTLTSLIYQGTGVDQGTTSWISGTWTSPTSSTQSNTLTTSYQKFTQTVTLGASTTELIIALQWNPVGTAGADDSVFITGVQLEKGSTATSFDYRPYSAELAMCQRYYQQIGKTPNSSYQQYGIGYAVNTTTVAVIVPLVVTMRASPSFTFNGATNTIADGGGAVTSVSSDINTIFNIGYQVIGSGFTAKNGSRHYQNVGNASSLELSAEL